VLGVATSKIIHQYAAIARITNRPIHRELPDRQQGAKFQLESGPNAAMSPMSDQAKSEGCISIIGRHQPRLGEIGLSHCRQQLSVERPSQENPSSFRSKGRPRKIRAGDEKSTVEVRRKTAKMLDY